MQHEMRDRGPWDVTEVAELGERIDLGALRVPRRPGLDLRLEMDKRTSQATAVALGLQGSALQLQAFAAPRSAGIWDEIRQQIADSITEQGGSVDDLPGPFGRELLARLPVRAQSGSELRPVRFLGHDGPRWFLRGVLSGRAALEPEQAATLEDVFGDVVVVRGGEARVPRELLPLTVPGQAEVEKAAEPMLDPFRRGPEITEVR